MRESWPSLTAMYVAFARALATRDRVLVHACDDPYAESLLPAALKPLLDRIGSSAHGEQLGKTLQALTLGLSHHLALRTALIDRALSHAVEGGIEQVVLVGAGLDARAHRMSSLSGAAVFEVDHPATQRFKQQRAVSLPVAARSIRYVACDFVRTPLAEALQGARFRTSERSVWVWEGVTMYLPREAVARSLASIASASADESMLIATYLTPDIVAAGFGLGKLASGMLALLSEPIRFAVAPEAFAQLLCEHGLELLSDTSPKDAAPHFGIELGRLAPMLPAERLAVAIKRGEHS